ncbi:MAG: transposase [Candidatus Levybacteria bacterium]|nr:transposase [Candidatus Levybacteria bacterium]
MATNRKIIFANGEVYHVYNRGVEKRPTFTNRREFARATETMSYYQYTKPPIRFSHFARLNAQQQSNIIDALRNQSKHIELLAYCLMPNHFHFLVRQIRDEGVSKFVANVTNSYTKYFNTKHERVGPLFQGVFKSAHIDSDELLLHVSRYIHLNPVSSFMVKIEDLNTYEWSSYIEYANHEDKRCETREILSFFSNDQDYVKFVFDQAEYGRTLEMIKHAILE